MRRCDGDGRAGVSGKAAALHRLADDQPAEAVADEVDAGGAGGVHGPQRLVGQSVGDLVDGRSDGVVAERDQAVESRSGQRGPQGRPYPFAPAIAVDEYDRGQAVLPGAPIPNRRCPRGGRADTEQSRGRGPYPAQKSTGARDRLGTRHQILSAQGTPPKGCDTAIDRLGAARTPLSQMLVPNCDAQRAIGSGRREIEF